MVFTLQGVPPCDPSALNPWSRVIWLDGMAPFAPGVNWPTKSVFQGALVAKRLYSPVPSAKLDRLKAARTTVFWPHLPPGLHARPIRGRKLAIPLYWL